MNCVRCTDCGKFISYEELGPDGGAKFFFEPLNEFGPEISEWTCKQCISRERAREFNKPRPSDK